MSLTDERFKRNDEEHNTIMEKLDTLKDAIQKDIKDLSVAVAEMPDKILARGDRRYASKTVEKVIYGVIGAAGAAIILALLQLIMK
jgi:hypothetical protein